ncbi:MAG: BtrH N-terminal domain-containing protein [Myxococcales bacterium]|nr:BtrH N-terminal domain-containing protein [Myxococcales bacterium]
MHRKGLHCGSTAMGDALRAKGLDLPETLVFGLGAGLGFSLHEGDTTLTPPQPSRFFVGRSPTFEKDLCGAVGATLHEAHFDDSDTALGHIDTLLAQGELPLVYTDMAELPYADSHAHWYGHLIAIPLTGKAWDNGYAETQSLEPAQLEKALCNPTPERGAGCTVLHLEGMPRAPTELTTAVDLQRDRMRAALPGIRALASELPRWPARPDWQRIARLAGQVIEVRGTGGGLFRRIYGQFLGDAGFAEMAMLCKEAADAWTELAHHPDEEHAKACAEAEEALWR